MTIQRHIFIGLEDIKAIVYECAKCSARLTLTPDHTEIPETCSQCAQIWIPRKPPESGTHPVSPLTQMLNALRRLRDLSKVTTLGVRIFFEIEEPKL